MNNNNKTLPKVLIVEDNLEMQDVINICLRKIAQVLIVETPEDAMNLIMSDPDLKLIAVDGSLIAEGDGVHVVKFAKEKGFSGPIVAMSGDLNDELMKAGATHKVNKSNAVDLLKKLISKR